MNKYYALVIFLLVTIVGTLHFFARTEENTLIEKSLAQQSKKPSADVTQYKYENYQLFRTKDRLFHLSYPSSWFLIDTTVENATKEADIYQSWTISDAPDYWEVKAEFVMRETNNNFEQLQQGLCAQANELCEKQTINGQVYSKINKTNPDGSSTVVYESWNGNRIIDITVQMKQAKSENKEQWYNVEKTFRFFR